MYLTIGLELEKEQERAAMSPELAASIASTLARVKAEAPQIGARPPAFTLADTLGQSWSLEKMSGRPLVISFIRGGWCPFCSLELAWLEEARPTLEALRVGLLVITPERPTIARATRNEKGVTFPVLIDEAMQVARSWGLVFALDPEWRRLYREDGVDLAEINGGAGGELPVPATFILDAAGLIRSSFVDPDYRRRLDPLLIIHTLEQMAAEQ